MENTLQKWIHLSYAAVSALFGYAIHAVLSVVIARFDIETRLRSADDIGLGLSIGLGILCFIILYRHQAVNQYMTEVATELSRVSWPQQSDTAQSTFIVIVMVLISAVLIGLVDQFWSIVIQRVLA